MQKTTNIDVKRSNQKNVLKYIIKNKQTSRQEIAESLHMSMPTILQNVKELQEMGFISMTGQYCSTGGRKASIVTVEAEKHLSLGIDITKNHISFVLVTLCGEILHTKRMRETFEDSQDYRRRLSTLLEAFVDETGCNREVILGAGISLPGILNQDSTQIVDSYVLNLFQRDCSEIAEFIQYPCIFMNDAKAAGYAESKCLGKDKNMIYISLSNSVGGAIYIDNALYYGNTQHACEFGHMRIVPGGRKCGCGQAGCLNAYCSALRLAEHTDGDLNRFFELLDKQDSQMLKVWEEYEKYLVTAITDLEMIFDCTVVLGGFVGAKLHPYLEDIKEKVRQMESFHSGGKDIRICHYQFEASASGVAQKIIDDYIERY